MENKLNLYGVYPAVVANTRDPKGLGRVSLRIASVLGSAASAWASPLSEVNTPVKAGDAVLVQFIGGDVTQPVFSVGTPTNPWQPLITTLQQQVTTLQQQVTALNQYPTAWSSLSPYFRGGVSAFQDTANHFAPQWRYESATSVKLRGSIKYTSNFANGSIPLDLSAGTPNLTPAHYQSFSTVGTQSDTSTSAFRMNILTDGTVTLSMSAYTTNWMSLDGIVYDLV